MNDNEFLISAGELAARLGEPGLGILDCRFSLLDPPAGRAMYEQAHIPGAAYADLDVDLAGAVTPGSGRHPLPDPDTLCATFGRLGIGNDTRVVVYDDSSGAIAARAWWLLRWLGHENTVLLDGGFNAWQEAGLPAENGNATPLPRQFAGRAQQDLVLETAEIDPDGVERAAFVLVDARSEARFLGEAEPIDPVAGRIPGARNLPFDAYLDDTGRWSRGAELSRHVEDVLGADRSRPWCVMCGSGVTACHVAMAGLAAGYGEPRIYVGSWSEWIRDPARKIATGPA